MSPRRKQGAAASRGVAQTPVGAGATTPRAKGLVPKHSTPEAPHSGEPVPEGPAPDNLTPPKPVKAEADPEASHVSKCKPKAKAQPGKASKQKTGKGGGNKRKPASPGAPPVAASEEPGWLPGSDHGVCTPPTTGAVFGPPLHVVPLVRSPAHAVPAVCTPSPTVPAAPAAQSPRMLRRRRSPPRTPCRQCGPCRRVPRTPRLGG